MSFLFFNSFPQIFDGYYHFQHRRIRKRSIDPADDHQRRLNDDDRVHWSKQQRVKLRRKRDFLSFREPRAPMGKLRIATSDPKWPQMWYLVSSIYQFSL